MAFTPPVNKKVKRSGRTKRLNIYNTDKYYNLMVTPVNEVKNYNSVNLSTKSVIDDIIIKSSYMDILLLEDKFLYVQDEMLEDEYALTMIKKGFNLFYYAKRTVPDKILDAMASTNRGAIIYKMHPSSKIDKDLINNVSKAHEATKVIIDCPVVIPDIAPVDVLTNLAHFSTNVDEVQVDIMPLHDKELREYEKPYYYVDISDNLWHCYPKHKFEYFKELKNPLSGWGMLINLMADTDSDYRTLTELMTKDKGK